jgi:hypothetical protein
MQWDFPVTGSGTLKWGRLGHIINETVNKRLQEGK